MSKANLIKNILFLFFVQVVNYVAPFLVLPYLSRMLSVENFGLIMMIISASNIALIITDFGFSLSGPLFVAKNKKRYKLINRFIGTIYAIKFMLVIFVWLVLLVIVILRSGNTSLTFHLSTIAWLAAIILAQSFQPIWLFQGLEKMKNITISIVISKMTYLLLIFTLVTSNEVNSVLVSLFTSNVVALLISNYLIYTNGYRIGIPNIKMIWLEIRNSTPFFVSRAAVGIYTSASTFIVGSFAGFNQAAIYSSAEKLYQAGQNALSPISQALYPYLARSGDKKTLYKFVSILFILISIVCISCIYYSRDIITIFFGDKYISAADILDIFLLSLMITFLSYNFGYPAFAAINKVKIANYTVLFGGMLQMLIIGILIALSRISPVNVAISVLITETIVLLIRVTLYIYWSKKEVIQ
ncbi:TPA: oligosaccharide flippase family protein [Citrobacter farmeri]